MNNIWIIFIPGSYGTTIEYMISRFTDFQGGLTTENIMPDSDGSMHDFMKHKHITTAESLIKEIKNSKPGINTVISPMAAMHSGNIYKNIIDTQPLKSIIGIGCKTEEDFDLLFLNQIYKIVIPKHKEEFMLWWNDDDGIRSQLDKIGAKTFRYLDSKSRLEVARDYLYNSYAKGLSEKFNYYSRSGITAFSIMELYNDLYGCFVKVVDNCNLTLCESESEIKKFCTIWKQGQQVIMDRYMDLSSPQNSIEEIIQKQRKEHRN